jgi:hypothetical protein
MRQAIYNVEILHDKISGIDNTELVTHIEETGEPFTDIPFHTHAEDTKIAEHPHLEKIVDRAKSLVREHLECESEVDSFWAHIHKTGESTDIHDHGKSDFACIYYVKTPKDCGALLFHPNPWDTPPIPYEPQEGVVVVFPSWLKHSVSKNKSKYDRISISFNLTATGPAEPPIEPEVV